MKLLYATSLSYPSAYANRLQVKATAEALGRKLGNNFVLGLSLAGSASGSALGQEKFSCTVLEIGPGHKSPSLAWKYFKFIKKEGITHVHVREERLAFFLRIYSWSFRVPLKLTYEAHFVSTNFFFKWSVRHSDGVVAITKGIKDELIGWRVPAEKILVASDAVDMTRFALMPGTVNRKELGLPQNKKIIMYTGSFTRYGWKGVDVLLDAAMKAEPDWLFVLIGGEQHEIAILKEKYRSSRIMLEEHIPQETVARFLTCADLLVIPNKKGERASEYYTSPLKLFEYMATGVPIIASDIPSIKEVLGETEATFFKANDAHSLAENIGTALAHYPAVLEKAKNAKAKVAAEYTWDKRAELIIDFINEAKN